MSSLNLKPVPLDPSFYDLGADELAFFKTQTGIQDEEELRKHILNVQAEAYAVYPYPCIRSLEFTTLRMSKYPSYDVVLKIGRENLDAIFLDLGCCFGNDTRKLIADGYPFQNIIASDIQTAFWTLGHTLFRSSPETFPVPFVGGDIFDSKFLAPGVSPAPPSSTPPSSTPLLKDVVSLTQLQHRISIIHVSLLFHLFSETQQCDFAHLLGSLLSPLPGSIIFGSHLGAPETAQELKMFRKLGVTLFGHSVSSWENIWTGADGVFKPEDVVLSTRIVECLAEELIRWGGDLTAKCYKLVWSVTRV